MQNVVIMPAMPYTKDTNSFFTSDMLYTLICREVLILCSLNSCQRRPIESSMPTKYTNSFLHLVCYILQVLLLYDALVFALHYCFALMFALVFAQELVLVFALVFAILREKERYFVYLFIMTYGAIMYNLGVVFNLCC